ncbi:MULTISPECIES: 30S ribosomal protein S21 [Lyngbya]|jgi:small subunit ribosomal protein S21|uniref:Small ribosomal subunit protein bS21 n=1 Tax=Lyngbya aestuarii BL J TaxID=1348334 RepID=U7QJ97_9CYAN|nr:MULTISPECIES: 30S ribosomal protein S21 [Lyngbya]EAW34119.1 Ribosomal protein S21 [Lyngbya sp. PCC 8106]ERT07948.1 ribosomal protein S21 [Lyngbya aestuarii BL J]
MAQVVVGESEQLESALRRFKQKVSRAGIFADMKKNRYFETLAEKQKRKEIARHRERRRMRNSRKRFEQVR